MNRYEDMIYMQRPVSRKHKPMDIKDRAAQFAPFAALTGYDDAVADTADDNETWIEEVNTNEVFREDP